MPSPLRRPRLSYANVTATLALVIATSTGGAYAAATIGSGQIKDNAVKSRHIANGKVKTVDLADGSVGASKLQDGSVGASKLQDSAVGATKLQDGSVGATKLQDGSVGATKLQDGSVGATKLQDGSVGQLALGADVAAPSAFGTVWHPGSVTNGRNLSSANVTRPETGVYCIQGLDFTPSIAVVSSAYEPNAFHHDLEVYGLMQNWGNTSPCPAASQIQIRVYLPGTTTEANGNFNIAIF